MREKEELQEDLESEDDMRLVIGFAHRGERGFSIDNFDFDDMEGIISLYQDSKTIGIINMNQVVYWFVED